LLWLSGCQNADGGWGRIRDGRTRILQTCSVLTALMAALDSKVVDVDALRPDLSSRLTRGLSYLTDVAQRSAGFFSSSEVADVLAAPHTIQSILVLQRARQLNVLHDVRAENKAIDWLLLCQDAARRLVVEDVELSPDNRYRFLYVTDSLLVRALSQSTRKQDRESTLFRAALFSVKDRIEPERGACYGYRQFTWSTARAISAMSTASSVVDDFPDRPAEFHGPKTGPILTVLMVVILAAAAFLGFSGRFSAQVAGFFALVVLAILLVNARIGEKTFAQLAAPLRSGKQQE
jgi:hypothetical protein